VARRLLAWMLGLLMLINVLPQIAAAADAPAKTPAVGGQLRLSLEDDPENFNPLIAPSAYADEVNSLIFSTLVDYNDRWEPQPNLAESWAASADGLTLTIALRKGVKFHDGTELTADDVAYTYQTILDPAYTGPWTSTRSFIKAISASDRYTVKVDLKEPQANVFSYLHIPIVSKRQFAGVAVKDLEKASASPKPIGTGPYKLLSYKQASHVTLTRNANYFRSQELGGAPFISTITFTIVTHSDMALAMFENGELDVLSLEPKQETDAIHKNNFPVDYDRNGWGYVSLNTERPHLNDKLVRQALTHALDRRLMARRVYGPGATVPAGPIPAMSWAYHPELTPLEHDSIKAMDLLEQAGYALNEAGVYVKDGETLTLRLVVTRSDGPQEIASYIQTQLEMIGVEVLVDALWFPDMLDAMVEGDFDMAFSGFSLSLDPDSLYLLFHSSQTGRGAFNHSRYSNPEVDALLQAGRRETDMTKRKEIYAEVQQILVEDAPIILIGSQHYRDWVSKKVKGGVRNFPGQGASDYHLWWMVEK
jgi:peptide/nickel transport system substrate-binding protein